MVDDDPRAEAGYRCCKLKEFQQKKTPLAPAGAKKKRRTKDDGSETATAPTENYHEICEACLENDVDNLGSGQRVDGATFAHFNTSNSSLPNTATVTQHIDRTVQNETLSQMLYPAAHEDQSEESRGVSSTESLRQLSAQLNGLVTQTTYVNGESAVCTVSPKELEKLFLLHR